MNRIVEFLGNINFEVIAQLTMITMIGIAGPMIIFLLAVRRGNL
ncbi:photosystem II reaction center protein Ycf12/Psb30 [uncultured Thermosynechococcus sp.]|nr:photosystem II reaction center protein Ycf12 [uncultured Thermosynechococcus sp.]